MEVKSSRKGDYQSFILSGDLDTQGCFDLKRGLFETIDNDELNVCLDMAGVTAMDSSGLRFIHNIQKSLERNKRPLVIYNCSKQLTTMLSEKGLDKIIKIFKNRIEYENFVTKSLQDIKNRYFGVSIGSGPIRHLSLKCPLCEVEGIMGYMCDESQHNLKWEDEHITPQWRLAKDKDNELDSELYEVAVCHGCLFASARLEHFTVLLPEGTIESTLKADERERLIKKISGRSNFMSDYQKSNSKSFFSLPREKAAGFISWQLYDKTVRDISRDKLGVQYIEVCRSNILSAKFSTTEAQRNNSLTTAHVWLTNMVEHPENQSTTDLVRAYIFLISVNYALEKPKQGSKLAREFLDNFSLEAQFKKWVDRAAFLVAK